MNNAIFTPADILIPGERHLEAWSVIACDQFSSERAYWDKIREKVGKAPSTLNMIIPEAYLGETDAGKKTLEIAKAMDECLMGGTLREIQASYVLVERTLPGGKVRRGLVGAIDLEEYDFSGKEARILASEGTVLDRLPARVAVRREAALELPHIMVFINDPGKTVIEPLAGKSQSLPPLYDFELMEGGGHARGSRVHGSAAEEVVAAMGALGEKSRPLMVVGDGNHSLAAAKLYWEERKKHLGTHERESHPARRALVEVNNVYDPAISFEAIHRVIWGSEPEEFIGSLRDAFGGSLRDALGDGSAREQAYKLRWATRRATGEIEATAVSIGSMLATLQGFLDDHVAMHGCEIDYIHGEESVMELTGDGRGIGIILPPMDKADLFDTVAAGGVFPKKSFSVGSAKEKRYYLECRRIRI